MDDRCRLVIVLDMNTKTIFAFVQAEYESQLNKLNQVSLHDVIITKSKDTKLQRKMRQEYDFIDQGSHLRGVPMNMTLTWCIMPKVGVVGCPPTCVVLPLPNILCLRDARLCLLSGTSVA